MAFLDSPAIFIPTTIFSPSSSSLGVVWIPIGIGCFGVHMCAFPCTWKCFGRCCLFIELCALHTLCVFFFTLFLNQMKFIINSWISFTRCVYIHRHLFVSDTAFSRSSYNLYMHDAIVELTRFGNVCVCVFFMVFGIVGEFISHLIFNNSDGF